MWWFLRHISAGWEELRVRYSPTMCEPCISFWRRLGMERAGTWWLSICVRVLYAISCSACIAFLTSMLNVATSWWRVDTCVSKRSIEFLTFDEDFASFIIIVGGGGSSSFSSSEMLLSIIVLLARLLVLTGLLLALEPRDLLDFSFNAMSVCLLCVNERKI